MGENFHDALASVLVSTAGQSRTHSLEGEVCAREGKMQTKNRLPPSTMKLFYDFPFSNI